MQAAESVSAEFDQKFEPFELSVELEKEVCVDQEEEVDDAEGEEFEFSFPCGDPDSLLIAAEDAFQDGHIRPIYPFFYGDLLYQAGANSEDRAASSSSLHQPLVKLFTEGSGVVSTSTSGDPEAEYCPRERRTVEEMKASSEGWAICRKSNSTGSSKLWRLKNLVHRSNSDGKSAFVFLNPAANPRDGERVEKKKDANGGENVQEKAPAAKRGERSKKAAVAAPPPLLYGRSKAAETRRTYLPYRAGLVGFFTSVNGLTKNVHPY